MVDLDGPVILEAITGSRAYGMDTPESDTDTLGIWVSPINRIIGLDGLGDKGSTKVASEADNVYHEIGKFCRKAITCNPTLLELLWIPQDGLLVKTPEGEMLREIREAFLHTDGVKNSYAGYAYQQALKLTKRPDHHRYSKHARHCFRLLLQAEQLLATGFMRVKLNEVERETVFAMGELGPVELMDEFKRRREEIFSAESVLSDGPNRELIDEVLRQIRWAIHQKA